MSLKIAGRVIEVLEEQSGTGQNGPWRKRDFVLETEGQYPAPVCITQWGDNIEKFDLKVGDALTAHIDLRSREYNGRWYTDVKAWKIDKEGADAGPGTPSGDGMPSGETPPLPEDTGGDDDLPF